MSNNGAQILALQNEDRNIRLLAAQKELYSSAKKLFIAQCIIAGPLAIAVSVLSITIKDIPSNVALISALYSVVALIVELILDAIITKMKKRASSIQELFDHEVLGIEWNFTLLHTKPDLGEVHRHYKKHKKKNRLHLLQNWYSLDLNDLQTNLATIISQRTNCTYDFSLRSLYSKWLVIVFIIIFLMLFTISAFTGITLQSFIVQILAPSAPAFILAWKQISANGEAVKNMNALRDLIEAVLTNSKIDSIANENTIRQIQDKIYYNRNLSPLLPDRLFMFMRNSLEENMNYSVSDQIRLLKLR